MFTAHLTGNFVLLGVAVAERGAGEIAKLLTLPVFLVVVAVTCLMIRALERFRRRPLVPVLCFEFVLLSCFFVTGRQFLPLYGPDDPETLVVMAFGVSAMAVQNALMRRVLRSLPSTTVMTSNLSQVGVDLVDAWFHDDAAQAARDRLKRLLPVVVMFGIGAIAAGFAYRSFGFVSLTAALALLAAAIGFAFGVDP